LRLPAPPTAIITSNNKMLLGLMRSVAELQVPCPGAVSIVGFDDFAWTQHFTPRLTTVAQPAYEMGRRAIELLLAKIRAAEAGSAIKDDLVLLKAELRVRESTAGPARESGPSVLQFRPEAATAPAL
jgi:LacI family transcriptional regulator